MKRTAFFLVLLALVFVFGTALAQPDADEFQLTRGRVDNGYGTWSSGDGEFVLTGTLGQPEGGAFITGADNNFSLVAGYWPGSLSGLIQRLIFLPFVIG